MIQPRLHYNYLQEAFDQQRLCDGVWLSLRLAGHKTFSAIMDTLYQPTKADLASKVVMHLVCFGEEPGIVGLTRIVHYM